MVPGSGGVEADRHQNQPARGGVDDDNSCVFLTGEYIRCYRRVEREKEHDNGAVLKAKVFF